MFIYKGTFGHVVLIGGNEQYGGAIILATMACVHSGAGLTTVITNIKNHPSLHAVLPEAMVIDISKTDEIIKIIAKATVIVVGPRLGQDQMAINIVQEIFKRQTERQWLVVDGSALTIMGSTHLMPRFPEHTVLTLHEKEWERISGFAPQNQTDENNIHMQSQLQTIVVLKSHRTKIYSNNLQVENPLGTAAMATGGMGDTLAGMIGGFLAQFAQNVTTVHAAVFLHSYIAEKLALHNYVVLPSTIIKRISKYMARFQQKPTV